MASREVIAVAIAAAVSTAFAAYAVLTAHKRANSPRVHFIESDQKHTETKVKDKVKDKANDVVSAATDHHTLVTECEIAEARVERFLQQFAADAENEKEKLTAVETDGYLEPLPFTLLKQLRIRRKARETVHAPNGKNPTNIAKSANALTNMYIANLNAHAILDDCCTVVFSDPRFVNIREEAVEAMRDLKVKLGRVVDEEHKNARFGRDVMAVCLSYATHGDVKEFMKQLEASIAKNFE